MMWILCLLGTCFDASVLKSQSQKEFTVIQVCSGHTLADLIIIMASSFSKKSENSGDSVSERNRDTSRLSLLQEPA